MKRPFSKITEDNQNLYYCRQCADYICEDKFYPSSIKNKRRCCINHLKHNQKTYYHDETSFNIMHKLKVSERKKNTINLFEKEDVEKILKIFDYKCFLSNKQEKLAIIRYDRTKPISFNNCVLICSKLIQQFKDEGLDKLQKNKLDMILLKL